MLGRSDGPATGSVLRRPLAADPMSGAENTHGDESSSVRLRRLLAIAVERIEAARRSGHAPEFDDLLAGVREEERESLRRDLRALADPDDDADGPALPPPPPPSEPTDDGSGTGATVFGTGTRLDPTRQADDEAGGSTAGHPARDDSDEPKARPAPHPEGLGPGTLVDGCKILAQIGRGGMGVVFRAYQARMDRLVALKVIRREWSENPDNPDGELIKTRFHKEIGALGKMKHPNIVTVYGAGEWRGRPYFTMELIEGRSLSARLRDEGPIPGREAARLLRPIAEAVAYSHRKGVLHRDVKPSNILIDPLGTPYLGDFGLAKILEGTEDLTETSVRLGTLYYMSPEQSINSARVGGPSDIYSLGATLYDTLTGQPPFRAADPVETLRQVREEPPVPPRRRNPAVPRDLETICLRCLEKEPARRYPTADDLADDLGRFLRDEPIRARPTSPAERTIRLVRRHPVVASLVAAIIGSLVIGIIGVTWQWRLAEGARRRIERIAYYDRLARASEAWSAYRLEQAERLLEGCPEPLRGWDWDLLWRLCRVGPNAWPGHSDRAFGLAIDPDGRRLVTSGWLGPPKLWDLQTGRELRKLDELPEGVNLYNVAWGRPAGGPDRIAAACGDQVVRLWEAGPDDWSLRELTGHNTSVRTVAFAPDARLLVASGEDGRVIAWELPVGKIGAATAPTPRFTAMTSKGLLALAVSPDGRRIACGGPDRTIRLIDAADGRIAKTFEPASESILSLAFAPDGRSLASGGDQGALALWDVETGRVVRMFEGHYQLINRLAFQPGGRRLASAGGDGLIKIWDPETGLEILRLQGHGRQVEGLEFTPDGLRLASTGGDGWVKVWDATPARPGDFERPEPIVLRGHGRPVSAIAVDGGVGRIASAGKDGDALVWDADGSRPPVVLEGDKTHLNAIAFGKGGLLATAGGEGLIRLWRFDGSEGGSAIRSGDDLDNSSSVGALAFRPDGLEVASAGRDPTIRLWATDGSGGFRVLGRSDDQVYALAYSPDGRSLASAGAGRLIQIWDLDRGGEPRVLDYHAAQVNALVFSPDGRFLASASHDGTARVWDRRTGLTALILEAEAEGGRVMGLAYRPDGLRLATAGSDGTVRIWNAESGGLRAFHYAGRGTIYDVAYTPDGRLVTGGSDGDLKLWPIADP